MGADDTGQFEPLWRARAYVSFVVRRWQTFRWVKCRHTA